MQDMDALVCRRTLTGHTHDVLSITGLNFHSQAQPSGSHYSTGMGSQIGSALNRSDSGFPSISALFASASADETVRIWDAKDWTCLRVIVSKDTDDDLVRQTFLSVLMTSRYRPCQFS